MDGTAAIMTPEASRPGAGVTGEPLEQRLAGPNALPSERKNAPHFPTPLQVSATSPLVTAARSGASSASPRSPTALRSISDSSSSPRSPRFNAIAGFDQPKSPRERLEEFLASDEVKSSNSTGVPPAAPDGVSPNRQVTASPSKMQSLSQLRNVSSPLPESNTFGHSSPPSPRSTATPPPVVLRQEARSMPRTSSIDSAISNISQGTSSSHKASQDSGISSSAPDVSHLIKAAGSPEAAIQHLLKEKQHADTQNTQLWKLVEKQRAMLHGLNKDLERAMLDRDRYQKKLQEALEKPPPVPALMPQATAARAGRQTSQSPVPSEASADLPIQRQSVESIVPEATVKPLTIRSHPNTEQVKKPEGPSKVESSSVAADEKAKGHAGRIHAHKQTSSSDVNIFQSYSPPRYPVPPEPQSSKGPANKEVVEADAQSASIPRPTMSPTSSFTAKRSQASNTKTFSGPEIVLAVSSPSTVDGDTLTPPRKPPPAPLDLGTKKEDALSLPQQYGPDDHSGSEYEDNDDANEESFERGRKKTRADDDREREAALSREQEERSRSKKQKSSKSRSISSKSTTKEPKAPQAQVVPMPPAVKALSPDPTPAGSFLSPHGSIAGFLNAQDPQRGSNISHSTVFAAPLSPGLPLSPRPADRPLNPPTPRLPRDGNGVPIASAGLSPRGAPVGLPLSPRAPRQPIPMPPQTPLSMAPTSPRVFANESRKDSTSSGQASLSSGTQSSSIDEQVDPEALVNAKQNATAKYPRGVFKGFASEQYPGFLIPPNALPSIKITVVSSRLKPSRQSLVLKGADEEPVFTLGVSARYDRRDLWQVEKPILSLHHLDQQLRQSNGFNVRLPDRSLFSGHAPAKVDARRLALEAYFEAVLDTHLDERSAVALCHYLSTNVTEPEAKDNTAPTHGAQPSISSSIGADKRVRKEGYLTKRGKNFGGWKARFFVLNKSILEYYETPGAKGGPLGQIRLHNAQIGKQSPKALGSPSRNDDGDGQYRHAFLIREPKRKDAGTFVDHVLCAESDSERDAWVEALLRHVDGSGSDYESSRSRPPLTTNSSASSKTIGPAKKTSFKNEPNLGESPREEAFDQLQAMPYEDTMPALAPHVSANTETRSAELPSPTLLSASHAGPSRTPSAQGVTISGPQNGAKISDVGAWGNKPMSTPMANPKDQKKRSIFGFRDKNDHLGTPPPNGSNVNLTQEQIEYQEHATNIRPVFGAPLAEAVLRCPPRGVDVCLPAVVYRCIEYLKAKNAAGEEGLFRMSGSNTLIKHLRAKFNAEGDFDFLADHENYYDVHAVASLLKLYLRELPPGTILTKELHQQFLAVLDIKEDSKKVAAYNILINRLPKPNYHLIKALSSYLITVVNNSDVNKMGIRNVCIVFSPTVNIPNPVLTMFFTAFDDIFERRIDPDVARDIPTLEVTASSPEQLAPDEIRSPRKQMFSELPTPSYSQTGFASGQTVTLPRHEQLSLEMGFTPLQSSYDGLSTIPYASTQPPGSVTVPGPEYGAVRPRKPPIGGDVKARRRESAMMGLGPTHKDGAMPMMRPTDSRESLSTH